MKFNTHKRFIIKRIIKIIRLNVIGMTIEINRQVCLIRLKKAKKMKLKTKKLQNFRKINNFTLQNIKKNRF